MSNAVVKLIPITIIYVLIVVFVTNFLLLRYVKITDAIPDLFFYMIYAFIFYSFYGYNVSTYASKNKCNRINRRQGSADGFKTGLLSVFIYLIVYFVNPLRNPFNELIGNNTLGNSVAETFYLSLNLIIISMNNYFYSSKHNCKIKAEEIEKNLVKLDKYLSSKKKNKKKVKKIVVKG